jgi:8-oxo-dGTP diphosphatase
MSDTRTHVVAGVIVNERGQVLLSRRPPQAHQGDLWEFPGGKVEHGESAAQALRRELEEELAIRPVGQRPLIQIAHDYPDRRVLLDVWRVDRFQGRRYEQRDTGSEGQPLRWVAPDDLAGYRFPAANRPVITAARLPDRYLITPEPGTDREAFLQDIRRALDTGVSLVRLRAWTLAPTAYLELAGRVVELCHRYRARVLLSGRLPQIGTGLHDCAADGLHLNRQQLRQLERRPVSEEQWLAASCHDGDELHRAQALGVDFVTLSPVLPTPSHADARPLGWQRFGQLCARHGLPVYALGGVAQQQLMTAWQHGGQGIAGIRAFRPDRI